MGITFIHTADWQIGKPFGTLAAMASLLADARFGAIDRIAGVAAAANARHVLVAGDVFDGISVPDAVLSQTVARMAAYPHLVWHLLPGNHDPAQPGGVWQRIEPLLSGTKIRLHLTAEPVEIEPGVLLLPAPLKTRAMSTDPTDYMASHVSAPGVIRIGFAHGSVRGFGSQGDAAVPIEPTRDRSARLDYLALGDWHGLTRIGDRVWYSGTPEPDGYKDNEPGHCLAVTIAATGTPPVVERHRTAMYEWLERTVAIRGAADLAALAADLKSRGAPVRPILLALKLDGRVSISDGTAIEAEIAGIRGLVRHLDLDTANMRPSADASELEAVFTGGLAAVAKRIAGQQSQGDADMQRIAGRALQMLANMAQGAKQP